MWFIMIISILIVYTSCAVLFEFVMYIDLLQIQTKNVLVSVVMSDSRNDFQKVTYFFCFEINFVLFDYHNCIANIKTMCYLF